jgi:hypothetical protein
MSKILYNYLNESLLFCDDYILNNYQQLSEIELRNELTKYREYCIKNIEKIFNEIKLYKHDIKIFSANYIIDTARLMQTAFYIDQVTLPDLIFEHTYEKSNASNVFAEFNGILENNLINRISLSKSAKILKGLSPMVDVGYLKIFPISYFFEVGSEIPFCMPTPDDVLTENIMNTYKKNVEIKSFTKKGQYISFDKDIQIRRDISIKFDKENDAMDIYQLNEQEILSFDESTNIAELQITIPDYPPTKDSFNAWLNQSLNKSALNHYQKLRKELELASIFKSQYLTQSSFTSNLLNKPIDDIRNFTTSCMINFDLNFFDDINIKDLMSIRQNDGEEFAVFRRELEKNFRSLRSEQDYEILKSKVKDISHEMKEVQLTSLDTKMKNLKKGVLSNILLGTAGFVGSFATSGATLLASAVAGINGYKNYVDYQQKIRENPSFFLWKIRQKNHKNK